MAHEKYRLVFSLLPKFHFAQVRQVSLDGHNRPTREADATLRVVRSDALPRALNEAGTCSGDDLDAGSATSLPLDWHIKVMGLRPYGGIVRQVALDNVSHTRGAKNRGCGPTESYQSPWCCEGQITGKEEGVGTGRIGGSMRLSSAKDAGVTFRLSKKERRRLAEARRENAKLKSVQTLRGERDMTPRLVKVER